MRCSTFDLIARERGLGCSTFLFALCLASPGLAKTPAPAPAPAPEPASAPAPASEPASAPASEPASAPASEPASASEPESASASAPAPAPANPADASSSARAPADPSEQTAKPLVGTPLPPPPPPLPAAKIARGVWRGKVRLDAGLNWSLPLPTSGKVRASGDLYGFGVELAASLRFLSNFGLGLRWAVSPHQNLGPSADIRWLFDARSSNRLMLTARGYWPSKGRLQPFAEVAGGYIYLNAFAQEPAARGGAWSASAGLDGLILPGWTLWGAARYRGAYLYERFGHRLELALGASLHF